MWFRRVKTANFAGSRLTSYIKKNGDEFFAYTFATVFSLVCISTQFASFQAFVEFVFFTTAIPIGIGILIHFIKQRNHRHLNNTKGDRRFRSPL
jgi:hypothetical protein